MSKIINKCQSNIIKNRNIMDGFMALHEILHDTKVKKKDGLVLKFDFEKLMIRLIGIFSSPVLSKEALMENGVNGSKLLLALYP